MSARVPTPESCPVCGASVPRGARACPECGADERSGWNENDARYDGLDLPDEAFDDGARRPHAPARPRRDGVWLVVTVAVLVAVILAFVFRR